MHSATVKEATSVKLDKQAKDEAKKIFKKLGLTMGEAFNLFLHQVQLKQGLPFDVRIPNEKTKRVLDEGRKGINMEEFSLEELKKLR
jgi:DNA-damage-inducible protein J